MKEKILNHLKEKMKDNDFLKENFHSLKEIKVNMFGNFLFEDVGVGDYSFFYETVEGLIEDVDNFYLQDKYTFEMLTKKGAVMDSQMFDIYHPEIAEGSQQIFKIIEKIDRDPELRELLYDYYVESVHDWEYGAIKNFTIKF